MIATLGHRAWADPELYLSLFADLNDVAGLIDLNLVAELVHHKMFALFIQQVHFSIRHQKRFLAALGHGSLGLDLSLGI